MLTRNEVLSLINNTNLPKMASHLKAAMLIGASNAILGNSSPQESQQEVDLLMLKSVGPAAAHSAMDFAIEKFKREGRLNGVSLNGDHKHNLEIIHNSLKITTNDDMPGDGFQNFSSVLRQFLLPRYAYLDFDMVVDPRHRIDTECGYPKFITPIMYRYMYDRDDVASRVVDFYPDESWVADPVISEKEDLNNEEKTPFLERWQELCDDYNILQYLYRIHKLARVGHYGVLLLGIDDGMDLEAPIDEFDLLAGAKRSVSKKQRNLLYLRPFDEYLSFIHQYETDVMSPRYGLPKFYNLVFLDMTIDAAGASIGTRLNRRVHWSRVIHISDNLQSSLVFGRPCMQSVFNRLLDLRKIKGSSGEMFYKGAWPGLSFEIDPRFVADEVVMDEDKLRDEIEDYANGLQRFLRTVGISVKAITPVIPTDPQKYVELQLAAIAANQNAPLRVWLGSEEGRVASTQDKLTWNQRLGRYMKTFVRPGLIRNVIDRFIAIGIMPPPSGKYYVGWTDLNTPTDEDKANLGLKWTQAMSQYVATGMIHLISPTDYLTLIIGLSPAQALRIVDDMEKEGGLKKLKEVDPSQGAGVNGNRVNQVGKGSREGTSGERPTPRDTSTKSTEGMKS